MYVVHRLPPKTLAARGFCECRFPANFVFDCGVFPVFFFWCSFVDAMDPCDVAKLVEELKLTSEAKEDGISLTPDLVALTHERAARCLVGKIFASRVTNRDVLRTNLPRILQIRNNIDVEIVGDNLFLVVFSSLSDRNHTLLHGPWHFFQSLMIFKEPKGLEKPSEV